MSKVSSRVSPESPATKRAPCSPPAGPDSSSRTASRPARPASMVPPWLCITARRAGCRARDSRER